MKAIIAIAVLLASSYLISNYVLNTPVSSDEHRTLFNQWKLQHGVSYPDEATEQHKFEVFVQNHKFIEQYNSEGHSSQVGHNQFSDLTSEEFGAIYASGNMVPEDSEEHQDEFEEDIVGGAPTSYDWTTIANRVTPVKNQGQCGSCWAFAGVEVLETLLAIKTNSLQVLSAQQLVDCDTQSMGCNGGYSCYSWGYAFKNGMNTNAAYPYTAVKGTCKYVSKTAIKTFGLKTPGYGYASPNTFSAMQGYIYKQPIAVSVQADQSIFQLYKSGTLGTGCGTVMNHAVVAVGYNNAQATIKIRNSWGTGWGVAGYATISASTSINSGKGGCGILTWAFWPTW